MIDDKTTINIPYDHYQRLLKDQIILHALYRGGVDNWDWYSDALEEAEKEISERKDIVDV